MSLRDKLDQINNRVLYLNLVITQAILFAVGSILYIFFLRKTLPLTEIYHIHNLSAHLAIGFIFALFVLLIDVCLMKFLPKDYLDDGGINERVFRDVNFYQIALIAFGVAFVEEWLFRGVLQNVLGLMWASLLFAVIHYRYFQRWIYAILVVVISFGFGFVYEWTQSIWAAIFAHFLIDFCLGIIIRYHLLTNEEEM